MNERFMKLAKQAGFCFWEDEHYGPGPGNIDWSSDYTVELEKFAEALIRDVVDLSSSGTDVLAHYGLEPTVKADMKIDLDEDLIMFLYEEAHRQDITVNKLIEQVLVAVINENRGADSE